MKKLFTLPLFLFSLSACAANFSGHYQCFLLDGSDGKFQSTLQLTLNQSASPEIKNGYASYDVIFKVKGMPYSYTGIAAARGNDLAIYFESIGKHRNPDDRGVGIASILVDKEPSGETKVSLHKFYYEKSYKGQSDTGFENCTRIGG